MNTLTVWRCGDSWAHCGAGFFIETCNGDTALQIAVANDRHEIMGYILSTATEPQRVRLVAAPDANNRNLLELAEHSHAVCPYPSGSGRGSDPSGS